MEKFELNSSILQSTAVNRKCSIWQSTTAQYKLNRSFWQSTGAQYNLNSSTWQSTIAKQRKQFYMTKYKCKILTK